MKRLLLLSFLLSGLSAFAGDWYVATNGTGVGTSWADATNNLQGAITVCQSNCTVWVSNGVYIVNLTVGGGVTVKSKTGLPEDLILNGNGAGRVVTMDESSCLIGCTVTNGFTAEPGGGIRGGSVFNCIVTGNTSGDAMGGGAGGGGFGSTFYNCLVSGNHAHKDLDFGGGDGGGGAGCTFYNSTVFGNNAGGLGGGGYRCAFINSISWGNNKADVGAIESFSCGAGFTGAGSITNDPLFVSSTDFHLQTNSPCINAGTNGAWTAGATDLDGNPRVWQQGGAVDMGAYEYGSQYPAFGVSIN
ncbi:MAG: choice-of-anchor Q domain-containing protein [Kiritimatiellae bacterium]|nr:choice-of-anchor Q domain-containing protein [Kiritimatiellia bacterium]